jgi:diamine N-acetyltransferase
MTAPVLAIRKGVLEDANLLSDLGRRTFHDTFASQNTPEDMAVYLADNFSPEIQSAELSDPRRTFLIAEFGALAAGYAQLRTGEVPDCIDSSSQVELVRIYVDQPWLGRGVGEALLRACLEESSKQGYDKVWLGVWEHNRRAIAFYEKWKFQIAGSHSFQLGADLQTDLLMERAL